MRKLNYSKMPKDKLSSKESFHHHSKIVKIIMYALNILKVKSSLRT